jgi:hypothetical protein
MSGHNAFFARLVRQTLLFILGWSVAGSGPAAHGALIAASQAIQSPVGVFLHKNFPSDNLPYQYYGRRVAFAGNTLVVSGGDHLVDHGGDGHVLKLAWVYEWQSGTPGHWQLIKELTTPQSVRHDDIETFSLAASGDYIVVGVGREDQSRGAAYLFGRNIGGPGNWGLVRRLTASDSHALDRFGEALAMDDDVIAIGATYYSTTIAHGPGAVYILHRNHGGDDNWGEVKLVTTGGDFDVTDLGFNLALDDNRLAVGGTGKTFLLERNAGGADNWGLVKTLNHGGAKHSPGALALDGETILIGTPTTSPAPVRVFYQDQGGPGNWGQVTELTIPWLASWEYNFLASGMGRLDDDLALIGAPGASDGFVTGVGKVFVFQRNLGGPNAWGIADILTPPDAMSGDHLGTGVAILGDLLVAAVMDDDTPVAENGGSVATFRLTPLTARDDGLLIQQNALTTTVPITINDTLPHGTPLTVTLVISPAHGTALLEAGGISYMPDTDYLGSDTVGYQVETIFTSATANLQVWVAETVWQLFLPLTRRG